jgi:hypothetical protein
MSSNDISFIYVVAGENSHYENLKTSIKSVRRIYPNSNIIVGDFDKKLDENFTQNLKIIDLSHIYIDRKKTFKHIIWQYKYFICQFTETKYNLYLDSDTVLVNKLDNLIEDSQGKFLIAKHFWVENVKKFKEIAEKESSTYLFLEKLNLVDDMDFCAAGVFFFEKNEKCFEILNKTFNIHENIYNNRDYIKGIYDETILNSVLQKELENVVYYNGSINHCSMVEMPMIFSNNTLYGKNIFDKEYKPITCLHCDKHRRDPSLPYDEPIKSMIRNLFEL